MKFGKKIVGGDSSGVFGYERYLEYKFCFSEPLQCLKMPSPTHVIVTLDKEGSFSPPPKEFRENMMAAMKDYFSETLEEEPWSDVEATLSVVCCAANPPLQGEENDGKTQKHS